MAFCALAFHDPKPEHRREMVERVTLAAELMAAVPGVVSAECWDEAGGDAVLAIGRFESQEMWLAAISAVAAADIDFDFELREFAPRAVQEFLA